MANINGKVFEIYPKIKCEKVHFKNRFGIELCGELYLPEGYEDKQNAAIIVSGPFGAVKEQSSGLYAQEFANMGFVSIAFDPVLPRVAEKSEMWLPLKSLRKISVRL